MSAIRRYSPKGRPYDVSVGATFHTEKLEISYDFTLSGGTRQEYRVKREALRLVRREDGFELIFHELSEGKWKTEAPKLPDGNMIPQPGTSDLYLLKSYYFHLRGDYHVYWEDLDYVNYFIGDMSFYNINPENLRQPQKIVQTHPFDEQGRNLAAVLRNFKQQNSADVPDIIHALSRLVEGIEDYSVSNVGSYLVTRLLYSYHDRGEAGDDGSRMSAELAQESDGTLRILSILAALYQIPSLPLVVIEEPESNIHPGALGVIADVLEEASVRSQVIVTTHHPDLIDRFEIDNLRVVDKDAGVTRVGNIALSQREAIRDRLFSPGELMRAEGLHRQA
jgi:hypothetical protein